MSVQTIDSKRVLTASAILGAAKRIPVEIPELEVDGQPGIVYARQPSAKTVGKLALKWAKGGDADANEIALETIPDMAQAIYEGIVDDEGNRLFSATDVERIADLDMALFQRLSTAVMATLPKSGEVDEGKGDSAKAGLSDSPTA